MVAVDAHRRRRRPTVGIRHGVEDDDYPVSAVEIVVAAEVDAEEVTTLADVDAAVARCLDVAVDVRVDFAVAVLVDAEATTSERSSWASVTLPSSYSISTLLSESPSRLDPAGIGNSARWRTDDFSGSSSSA